jgi:hypothetical protein
MRIHSYIFSYERPWLLYANAAELARIGSVTIVDDRSSSFTPSGYPSIVMPKHGGKEHFMRMWHAALADAKERDADVFIFSPDDVGNWDLLSTVLLVAGLQGTHRHWAINFLRDQRDSQWNGIMPEPGMVLRQVPTDVVGFVDCALIVDRHTLEAMEWTIPHGRKGDERGSGVGRWLTDHLNRLAIPIYRPQRSFCDHLGNDCSVMHPDTRPNEPIVSVRHIRSTPTPGTDAKRKPVTANIATYPAREETLKKMLASIEGQFDRVRICLNGYSNVPKWLAAIPHVHAEIPPADVADNGKFMWLDHVTEAEHYFMLDDDLIYPSDYVATTLAALRKYPVVTYHGRNLNPKARTYYGSNHEVFRCTHGVIGDHMVHVGGTGVMAIDTEAFCPKNLVHHPNLCMADLVMAEAAAMADVPIRVVEHNGQWIQLVQPHPEDTIHARHHKKEQGQWPLALKVLAHLFAPEKVEDVPAVAHTPVQTSVPDTHFVVLNHEKHPRLFGLTATLAGIGDVSIADNATGTVVKKYPMRSPATAFSREEWYQWWQMAFDLAKERPAKAYAFIMAERAGELADIHLLKRMTLTAGAWAYNLHNDGRPYIWNEYTPIPSAFHPLVEQVNFVDGSVVISHAAMEALGWKFPEVPKSWHTPGRSSGIGYHLSEALLNLNVPMYRTIERK